MVYFSEEVKMFNSQRRNSVPFIIPYLSESAASAHGLLDSMTTDPAQKTVCCDDKGASHKYTMRIQIKGLDSRSVSENHFPQKSSRHNCGKTPLDCIQDRAVCHTALADITNPEVKGEWRRSDSKTKINLFPDHEFEDGFQLPPLPRGSLTFQSALRDLQSENSAHLARETKAPRGGIGNKCPYATGCRLPRLAWYGPLVDYKGHQVYLSTRNHLNTIIRKAGDRKWCF